MRILVVSNLYPPHHHGGYELACSEVVDALRERGHEVAVLTSSYPSGMQRQDHHVRRLLNLSPRRATTGIFSRLLPLLRHEWINQRAFRRTVRDWRPEVVYFWHPSGISLSLAVIARQLRLPVVFYIFDYWLDDDFPYSDPWLALFRNSAGSTLKQCARQCLETITRLFGLLTSTHGAVDCRFQFGSSFLEGQAQQYQLSDDGSSVIHYGVKPHAFPFREDDHWPPQRLLYVGQLIPIKGVETAIEAVAQLARATTLPPVTLDIVGGSTDKAYEARLKSMVKNKKLDDRVRFCGATKRSELPGVYRDHDILLFPTTRDEPFGIVLLEAMAAGCAIVATATGGSTDILQPAENSLKFDRGDAGDCAAQVRQLLTDEQFYRRLRRQAQRTVTDHFDFTATIVKIEKDLQKACSAAGRSA